MASPEQPKPNDKEGTVERLSRWNAKKGLWFVGGFAVAAVLAPEAGILTTLAAGAGVETLASKYVYERAKKKRLSRK